MAYDEPYVVSRPTCIPASIRLDSRTDEPVRGVIPVAKPDAYIVTHYTPSVRSIPSVPYDRLTTDADVTEFAIPTDGDTRTASVFRPLDYILVSNFSPPTW